VIQAKDVMTQDVKVVNVDDTVGGVIRCFLEEGITSAVVVDNEKKVKGIITDGDILAAVRQRRPVVVDVMSYFWAVGDEEDLVAKTESVKNKKVKEIMTKHVVTVSEDTSVPEIARLMVEHGIKQIPVVRAGQIVGLVRRKDIVKAVAEAAQEL